MRIIIIAATILILASACRSSDEDSAAEAETDTAQTEAANQKLEPRGQRKPVAAKPESKLQAMTMNGSSVEEFEASLAKFEAMAPTEEVTSLKAAVSFLLVYDLAARGNKEKLYERLNGMTPGDIIDNANAFRR